MIAFYNKDIFVNRNSDELLSALAAKTIQTKDERNYGRKCEFRGDVWVNGFSVALNTYLWNSFESEAAAYIEDTGDNECIVHLRIGPQLLVLVCMFIWNIGLFVALAAFSISAFSDDTPIETITIRLLIPFIIADVVFLRFALYSNYKKLKAKILEFLG